MQNLEIAIKNKRLVDFNLFNGNVTYTGICLIANKRILVIVNFDLKGKEFNGFTIFKNQDFDTFEIWKQKFVDIKKNNLIEFKNKYKIEKLNTFYSWLKLIKNNQVVAVFIENNHSEYFVGQIESINLRTITMKLIDKSGNWINEKEFKISEINYFSFDSKYERKLQKRIK